MSSRSFRSKPNSDVTYYPRLQGTNGACATHHNLSAMAARDVLSNGGNAVDAAVAAVLVEGLVNPHMNSIGGECPILIRMADTGKVVAINGNTAAPQGANPEYFLRRGWKDMPDSGILAAGVPATMASLLLALESFGRLSFADVATTCLALANGGFPVHRGLLHQENFGILDMAARINREWPGSATLYLVNGNPPAEGSLIRNTALASMLNYLIGEERGANGSREDGIKAVRAGFYKGDVAAAIDRYSREHDGLLNREDLAIYQARLEQPLSRKFQGAEIFKCGFWTQGPTVLQSLAILDRFDLRSMGHNSADYLHTVIEAVKLVYADREQFYGDGQNTEVPEIALLSDDYAALRAALIDPARSLPDLQPGDPVNMQAKMALNKTFGGASWGHGTVHVDVIDADGNMVAATPSGGRIKHGEVMPDLGFPHGNRLMTFYLGPDNHPNCVAGGKRPRTTISPSLLLKDDRPWMVFGTMGGDQQDQWQLQYFLNLTVFGMSLQQAIEAPKFSSEHFPGFFSPHDRMPNQVRIEERVDAGTLSDLERRGHVVAAAVDWTEGHMLAASQDPDTGLLEAGCDPRCAKSEIFPATALCW